MLRGMNFGDGIGLRNMMWEAMNGDAIRSKKLMEMTYVGKITDVKYKFQRFGIRKYFADVHKTLAKLQSLGAQKQDWEVFVIIFDHLSQQCDEYRQVVSDLRDKIAEDTTVNKVTLKSIEVAFTRKETVHRIGTDNKGTPVAAAPAMNAPPAIPAAKAKVTPTGDSKLWPEKTATSRYGPQGSHKRGSCKYSWHKHSTDHCWSGCDKCGGCQYYHKRCRMMNEGHKMCTLHPYAMHLEKD